MHEDGGFYRWFYFDELSKDINYTTKQLLLKNKLKWYFCIKQDNY